MKVGLLIYGSLDTVSGGYLYDRKLVEYVQSQGDQVQVVSIPWRNYASHLVDNLSKKLYQQLLNLDVDVLLQDELNHPSLFWLNRRLAGKVSYPIIAIVHHLRSSELRPVWQNHLYAMVEREYLKTVQGFIFNSQTTRKVVEGTGTRLDLLPWIVAYPAGNVFSRTVNDEYIRSRASAPGPLHVVFIGNVIERKGLHILLEACGRLPPGSFSLDVIGSLAVEPAYTRLVQQQATSMGSEHTVQFHGKMDHASMETFLLQSHVLAVPSSYEGFGIVYLEGMSFGLPAIAGTMGAAWEIITAGENGFLVAPGDSAELASVLQQLSSDRLRLAEMGIAALKRYLVHPTWEDTGEGVREFLKRVR